MEDTVILTPAQTAVIAYFSITDKAQVRKELGEIVKLNLDGAKIDGPALAAVFDKLGYDGRKEVSIMTYDFADQLAKIYKEITSAPEHRQQEQISTKL